MQIGSWDKLPHYNVVGQPTMFYVWINVDGKGVNSKWLTGEPAFAMWFVLLEKFNKTDKTEYIRLLQDLYISNR